MSPKGFGSIHDHYDMERIGGDLHQVLYVVLLAMYMCFQQSWLGSCESLAACWEIRVWSWPKEWYASRCEWWLYVLSEHDLLVCLGDYSIVCKAGRWSSCWELSNACDPSSQCLVHGPVSCDAHKPPPSLMTGNACQYPSHRTKSGGKENERRPNHSKSRKHNTRWASQKTQVRGQSERWEQERMKKDRTPYIP